MSRSTEIPNIEGQLVLPLELRDEEREMSAEEEEAWASIDPWSELSEILDFELPPYPNHKLL